MISQGRFFLFQIKLLMLLMLELQPEGVKKKMERLWKHVLEKLLAYWSNRPCKQR